MFQAKPGLQPRCALQGAFCRPTSRCNSSIMRPRFVQPLLAPARSPLAHRSSKTFTVVRAAASTTSNPFATNNPFQYPRELDGLQATLGGLSQAAFYAAGALLVAVGGGAGYLAGSQAPGTTTRTTHVHNINRCTPTVNPRILAGAAGALAGAAGAAYAAMQLKTMREGAAAVLLYNLIVSKGDPRLLTRDDVAALESQVGVALGTALADEVKPIYGAFVEAIIPVGDEPLTGEEAASIVAFKDALGLDDTDAAAVHIDVGRRILRSRFEAGSRGGDVEQRKTFQKLIYVSTGVFGEQKSAYLLPWKRVFELSDAQIVVAKRDNAKQLFVSYLQRQGEFQASKAFLTSLKEYVESIRLSEDVALEALQEATRAAVEGGLGRAIECVKQRTRVKDYTVTMRELKNLLAFNRSLATLADDPDVIKGVARVAVYGGRYEEAATRADLKELLRVYLDETLSAAGAFTDALEADVRDLAFVMGLSSKEVDAVRGEVVSRMYRKLLREAVQSGRLEGAESPATVLQALCDTVHYAPQQAAELHRGLYRQKLESMLEKKKLTEADQEELSKLRKLLCIPKADRDLVHMELCGSIYRSAVEAAVTTGIDGFDSDERQKVRTAQQDVALTDEEALDILGQVGRQAFMGFVRRARSQNNRLESAKELKKLVFFSNIVIAPLVEDLQPVDAEAQKKEQAMKEFAEILAKAKEEAAKEEAAEKAEGATEAVEAEVVPAGEEAPSDAGASTDFVVEAEATTVDETDAAADKETAAEAAEDGEVKPASLAKAEKAAASRVGGEEVAGKTMRSQKVVNLANEVDVRERTDIYRNFLLYCMSGDVVNLPMGSQVVIERDESEFARLSQLGDILGLSPFDVSGVHQGLAEQAFRNQAQALLADGVLTAEKSESLTKMREQMGLPQEAANKIIKGIQNQRLIGTLQTAKAQGQLTLDKILEMKEQGVEIDGFVSEDMRVQLYSAELTRLLSSGEGEMDEEYMLKKLPEELSLDQKKVTSLAQELAKDKKRTILVQAISNLRQRNIDGVATALNNLAVAYKLVPGEGDKWGDRTEVLDLYSVYVTKESNEAKQQNVASILGIDEAEAANLKELVNSGAVKIDAEVEEEAIF